MSIDFFNVIIFTVTLSRIRKVFSTASDVILIVFLNYYFF